MADKKRNIMRAFKMHEISGVDVPAQQGARTVLMKRAGPDDDAPVAKAAALTTEAMDHVHLIRLDHGSGELTSGETDYSYVSGDGRGEYSRGHTHPWIRTEDGRIVLGVVHGHTHEVAEVSKGAGTGKQKSAGSTGTVGAKEVPNMTDKTQKNEPGADAPTVEQLQAQLAAANAIAALNDAEKAYHAKQDDAGKAAFLAKSAEDRKAVLDEVAKAANDADPVVYKALDGTEFRKSDDSRLVAMAKSADADRKENAELRKKAADADLRKRATDLLPNLPGTVETHMALLKSVDGITDEKEREAALTALKGQNAAMAHAFVAKGHGGSPAQGSSDDQLDQLAKKHAEDNKVSYAKAYDAVLQTPEGQDLYNKSLN